MTTATRIAELRQILDERRLAVQDDIQMRVRSTRSDRPNEVRDFVEDSDASTQSDIELALVQMRAETVTRIDQLMVGRWGMSERIGPLSVLPAEGDPRMAGISDGLLDAVDEEVRRITDECYEEARKVLRENRDKLDAIVTQLLARESLDEPEIYAAAGIPRPPVTPSPTPVPA